MDLEQKVRDFWRKVKRISSRIDRRLPNNWRYYTETFIGVILTISAIGNFLSPYISIVTSLVFLTVGIYTIPDLRLRILYKLDINPPKYSVPAVVILGLLIGSLFTSPSAIPGSETRADFYVENRDLTIVEQKPVKYAVGEAEITNRGLVKGNYTAGIFVNGNLRNHTTTKLNPGDSEMFNLSAEIQRQGNHDVLFFGTRGDIILEDNLTGFSVERQVNLPYYLNEENIRTTITGYSPIPQKNFNNITELEVNTTEDGNRVKLVNRLGTVFDTYEVMKKSSANSFHASKRIYQEFDNVQHVKVVMEADYTHPNGTVEIRDVLETGLSSEDASQIDWDNATGEARFDYSHWLNLTSSYRIEEELCEALSKDVECSK